MRVDKAESVRHTNPIAGKDIFCDVSVRMAGHEVGGCPCVVDGRPYGLKLKG